MKLSRKSFLRLTSATSIGVAFDALLTACGGGGGGSSGNVGAAQQSGGLAVVADAPGTSSNATVSAIAGHWSNPATWGGILPTASDPVTIAAGRTVILDVANAVCFSLDIQGSLVADLSKDLGLATGNINVGPAGVWTIGTEAAPYPAGLSCTITLNGAETARVARTVGGASLGFSNSGVGRSIQVQPGGRLNFIGTAPAVTRTKLNAHAAAAATSFILEAANTGWQAGDEIALGTTDFYGIASAERLVLAGAANGAAIATTTAIAAKRWGVLQYVTDSGMSLSPGTLSNAPVGTPTVLDERAFVVHLTRNIMVQGANDTAWINRKFGAHCMFMGQGSDIKFNGVRFLRCGQAGAIGRYPLHWHMMSYDMPGGMNAASNGAFLGAVTGNYARNCAVDQSAQRMMVIHGTHGVTLDANVGFDITGHAIFLEDGSEQNNILTNNAVLKVRAPSAANRLLNHDRVADPVDSYYIGVTGFNGSSGMWISNPQNTVTDNWVNDAAGTGIWNAFAAKCFGLSTNVGIVPLGCLFTSFQNNWAFACNGVGVQTNRPPINDAGDTSDSTPYEGRFFNIPVIGMRSFKNRAGGYSNRVYEAKYQNFITADNAGLDVFGQTQYDSSVALNFLAVGESLNNSTSLLVSSKRAAFATYHETLNFKNCIVVGFSYVDGGFYNDSSTATGGGMFRMDDLYMQPTTSFYASTGNKLINTPAPFRTKPPNLDSKPLAIASMPGKFRNWTLSGAIKDINGLFIPAGRYWVYDVPFFTYSATNLVQVAPSGSNGVHTPDRYFGIDSFNHTDDSFDDFMCKLPITVTRQDSTGVSVGQWIVGDGSLSPVLGWMRHFAAHQGGRYVLKFPGHMASSVVQFNVTLMDDPNDIFLLGVEFNGAVPAKVFQRAQQFASYTGGNVPVNPGNSTTSRSLTAIGSLASVLGDTTGSIFWQDTANNMVWFKVAVGNLAAAFGSNYAPGSQSTYKPVAVAVTA